MSKVQFITTASLLDEFIEYEFMDSGSKLPKRPTEDIFAEAITRVEAGEPVDVVLAAYPAEHQAELRDLLLIIAVAGQIQQAPVPRPALDRRAARKQAFLQTAAELRVERAVNVPPVTMPVMTAGLTLAERWQALWSAIQAAFTVRTMQLAPLIVGLTLIVLSSFSLVTFAQDALPGDVAYPMKEWMRYQKLNLSPPAQQPQLLLDNERELQSDIQKAREKAQQKADTTHDLNNAVVKARSTLIFHGDEGHYFVIGGLQVLKKYQPDANQNQNFRDLTIEGQPAPGKQVILEYQILPVQSGKDGTQIVQGISLRVLETAPVVPTPVPTNTPVPTYTPTPPDMSSCVVKPISGWLPYQIQPGDTLSALAHRTATNVSSLLLANCLASDVIPASGILLLPPIAPTATPVIPPTPVVTVTPTEAFTATVTSVETTTIVATLEATVIATEVITGTEPAGEPTLAATSSATSVITSTITPAATETALATSVATPEPSATSSTPFTSTAATTPGATPTSTATSFPIVTPTPTPTVASSSSTATATAAATDGASVTPEPAITPASAGTPTAVNTSGVPEQATPTATVVALPTFTQTPMPAATQVEPPTATPLPPPTEAPTQAPPTQAPPTQMPPPTEVPPTQVPPIQVPPTQAPLPTTAESTDSAAVKSSSQPSPVQPPTLIVLTPTPASVSPIH